MSRGISGGMTGMLLKATLNRVCSSCPIHMKRMFQTMAGVDEAPADPRGEFSYLAPLGSENISAPYFKQCFFQGVYYPPDSQTPRLPVPRQK